MLGIVNHDTPKTVLKLKLLFSVFMCLSSTSGAAEI